MNYLPGIQQASLSRCTAAPLQLATDSVSTNDAPMEQEISSCQPAIPVEASSPREASAGDAGTRLKQEPEQHFSSQTRHVSTGDHASTSPAHPELSTADALASTVRGTLFTHVRLSDTS